MAVQPEDRIGPMVAGAASGPGESLLAGSSAEGLPVSGGGMVLEGPLATAGVGLAAARAAGPDLVRVSEEELTSGLDSLNGLRADLDRVTVTVLLEAVAVRGLHVGSGLSVHDWVSTRCPWLPRAEVGDLVVVATEAARPGHGPIREALTGGTLTPRRAARLLRALRQLRPAVDADGYEMAVGIMLPVAAEARYSEKDLKQVTDHLLGLALPAKDHEATAKAAAQMRGVHESSLADGSVVRFVVTTDAEGAATIRAVLQSPLAAPTPDDEGPDERTATQRRHDALLTVLGRGVSAPEGTPTTTKAKVVITMAWDVLKAQLVGVGQTLTGEALSPATVRKIACTADLIPAVLGSHGELLDLGRAARLASPAQHLALWRRTGTAPTQAARCRPSGATRTTSTGGPAADTPTWPTWPCSAGDTTPSCTTRT